MTNFEKWDKEYRRNNINAFTANSNGLLWLKVRALSRKNIIRDFAFENGLQLTKAKISQMSVELFGILEQCDDAMSMLDRFLKDINHEWYVAMNVDIKKLKDDLYKVKSYAWGGNHSNSLDKHLVSRYVKTISDFSILCDCRGDIAENAWNYVQNSWYNNWTSFLIESLFKHHDRVVPAVGEIKNVDFFIDNYPIDLKVTYFPNEFMYNKLKLKLGKSQLSMLKAECKKIGISTKSDDSEAQQIYTFTEKLMEVGNYGVINLIKATECEIIREAQFDSVELMTWLYEHQGEMRFGAENRLFLILADTEEYSNSWKLKRAFSLIEPKVKAYIDSFSEQSLKKIDFSYQNHNYTSLADTIFIVK